MHNITYDRVVFVTRILVDALAALYIACAMIWDLPYAEQVGLTATAFTAFCNSILKIKSNKYFDDHEIVEKGEG